MITIMIMMIDNKIMMLIMIIDTPVLDNYLMMIIGTPVLDNQTVERF